MSINTWTPDNQSSHTPATIELQKFIEIGNSNNIEQLVTEMTDNEIDLLTPVMKKNIEFWHEAAANCSAQEIISLIRFFTLAEEKHSPLFAGKLSPVIALNKLLKKRNESLSKEVLLWIKAHSSNRYLPNGSIL